MVSRVPGLVGDAARVAEVDENTAVDVYSYRWLREVEADSNYHDHTWCVGQESWGLMDKSHFRHKLKHVTGTQGTQQ